MTSYGRQHTTAPGRRVTGRLLAIAALAPASGACTLLASFDQGERDAAKTADAAGGAAGALGGNAGVGGAAGASGAGGGARPCPSEHGAMVLVRVAGGASYCIDSAEVANIDYQSFLGALTASPPVTARQPTQYCAWNNDFVPAKSGGDSCAADLTDATQHPFWPVSCVDWCDAYAYCAWAGKRLCGLVGGQGVPVDMGSAFDPAKSEWHNACTDGGTRAYPYSNRFDVDACNVTGANLRDVPGHEGESDEPNDTCVGGFPGVYDMSGNLQEWENSCNENDNGDHGSCQARGGGDFYTEGTADLERDPKVQSRCDANVAPGRDYQSNAVGFRCCADATP